MANTATGEIISIDTTGAVSGLGSGGTGRLCSLVWSGMTDAAHTCVIYNKSDVTYPADYEEIVSLKAGTGLESVVIPLGRSFSGLFVKTLGSGKVKIY